jgi:hypothetical protein
MMSIGWHLFFEVVDEHLLPNANLAAVFLEEEFSDSFSVFVKLFLH